ncbi:hypothetical protein ACFVFF_23150 [Streptomyces sp. NPDC057680]|uniref:hypothetical protein n=1 Tax=Streptomyces sp. NPDC057680 TaxID=3346208 RepID=UPI0036BA8734
MTTLAPDPRAVLLDAISTALNSAGYWLPIDGKRAVADAVLKAGSDETSRRLAITFQTRIDDARDWARGNLDTGQQEQLLRVLRGDPSAPTA